MPTRPRRALARRALPALAVLVFEVLAATSLASGAAQALSCTVAAPGMMFGTYNPLARAPSTITTTITVRCQSAYDTPLAYQIMIGQGAGGSFTPRRMGALAYQLYTNASHTVIWGDGTSGTSPVGDAYQLVANVPASRAYTIYGQIPAPQNVAPGSYSDTLTIILAY